MKPNPNDPVEVFAYQTGRGMADAVNRGASPIQLAHAAITAGVVLALELKVSEEVFVKACRKLYQISQKSANGGKN